MKCVKSDWIHCWIFRIRNPAVWGIPRTNVHLIYRLSCETKQYPIRKPADRILKHNKRSHGAAQKDLDAGEPFFSSQIYCNLYISPGLMFCFWLFFKIFVYCLYQSYIKFCCYNLFWAVTVYFLFMFNKSKKYTIIAISPCHYQRLGLCHYFKALKLLF